jgi:hypothetical protein
MMMTPLTDDARGQLSVQLCEARAVAGRARDDGDYQIARWWEARAACLAAVLRDDRLDGRREEPAL